VPPSYLSKVLQALGRGGIVKSQRGVGGGISLARKPEELTILEVVNAVEPIQRIKTCPLGLKSHGVRLCPLHRRIDDALAHVEAAFGGTTLAEVLAEPTHSPPLCEVGVDRTRRTPVG
jgi:Rrf2 family protein